MLTRAARAHVRERVNHAADARDSPAAFLLVEDARKTALIEKVWLQIGYKTENKAVKKKVCIAANLMKIGAACRIRTDDLPLTRRLLYQLS
jgi:hypothetical protein